MSTFAVNDDNDFFLGTDGNLSFLLTGLEATLQVLEHYAKAQLGEMIYQIDQGVPYFDNAFQRKLLQQFQGRLSVQLLRVENVIAIVSLDIIQNGDILEYVATIKTTFGIGTINGVGTINGLGI